MKACTIQDLAHSAFADQNTSKETALMTAQDTIQKPILPSEDNTEIAAVLENDQMVSENEHKASEETQKKERSPFQMMNQNNFGQCSIEGTCQ